MLNNILELFENETRKIDVPAVVNDITEKELIAQEKREKEIKQKLDNVSGIDYENHDTVNIFYALTAAGIFGFKENKGTNPDIRENKSIVLKNNKFGISARIIGYTLTMDEERFLLFMIDLIRQGKTCFKISFYSIYKGMGYMGKPSTESLYQIIKTINVLSATKIDVSQTTFTIMTKKGKKKQKGGYVTTGGAIGFIKHVEYEYYVEKDGIKEPETRGWVKLVLDETFIAAVLKNNKYNTILSKSLLTCKSNLLAYVIDQLNAWRYERMSVRDLYLDIKSKGWETEYREFKRSIIQKAILSLSAYKKIELKGDILHYIKVKDKKAKPEIQQ